MSSREARWNKKLDNRGAAIALTIVAIAMISVLAALALWIAYMNYYMKVADMRSTDTFYSAESVVEQMRTGLQNELAEASGDAYQVVLQRYSELTETERKTEFMSKVSEALMKNLIGADANHYNLKKLCEYVPTTDYAPLTYAHLGSDNATAYTLNTAAHETADVSSKTGCIMERNTTNGTIMLRDVNVLYTNSEGYVSIINTDFRVQIPELDFGDTAMVPDLFKFTVIADQHLRNFGSGGNTTFTGSVYGGNGDYPYESSTSEDKDNGIVMDNYANWTFNDAVYLISGKTIKLHRSAKFNVPASSSLWAEDISLGGGKTGVSVKEDNAMNLNLQGTSYIADDTAIEGKDCEVTISNSYFGYGNGDEDHEDEEDDTASSAILINGQNTDLDLSGLTTLLLGGRSYIGTKRVELPSGVPLSVSAHKNLNIPMSDSIAVRGNQIAYLVPPEGLPLLDSGNNPVPKAEYESRIMGREDEECDLEVKLKGTDRYLTDFASTYKKVFAQGINDYLVYYYMVMDTPEKANEFFETYYSVPTNKDNLDKYIRKYLIKDMQLMDISLFDAPDYKGKMDVKGDWISVQGDRPEGLLDDRVVTLHKASEITKTSTADTDHANYSNIFTALKCNLTPSATETQKTKRVFDNWVNRSVIETEVPADGRRVYITDSGSAKGVITRESTFTIPNDSKIRLVISTGNVQVKNNFKGTIIAAGNIIVQPSVATIGTDETAIGEIMELLQLDDGYVHVYDYLVDGERFKQSAEDLEDEETETDLNELVSYENWTKR